MIEHNNNNEEIQHTDWNIKEDEVDLIKEIKYVIRMLNADGYCDLTHLQTVITSNGRFSVIIPQKELIEDYEKVKYEQREAIVLLTGELTIDTFLEHAQLGLGCDDKTLKARLLITNPKENYRVYMLLVIDRGPNRSLEAIDMIPDIAHDELTQWKDPDLVRLSMSYWFRTYGAPRVDIDIEHITIRERVRTIKTHKTNVDDEVIRVSETLRRSSEASVEDIWVWRDVPLDGYEINSNVTVKIRRKIKSIIKSQEGG